MVLPSFSTSIPPKDQRTLRQVISASELLASEVPTGLPLALPGSPPLSRSSQVLGPFGMLAAPNTSLRYRLTNGTRKSGMPFHFPLTLQSASAEALQPPYFLPTSSTMSDRSTRFSSYRYGPPCANQPNKSWPDLA